MGIAPQNSGTHGRTRSCSKGHGEGIAVTPRSCIPRKLRRSACPCCRRVWDDCPSRWRRQQAKLSAVGEGESAAGCGPVFVFASGSRRPAGGDRMRRGFPPSGISTASASAICRPGVRCRCIMEGCPIGRGDQGRERRQPTRSRLLFFFQQRCRALPSPVPVVSTVLRPPSLPPNRLGVGSLRSRQPAFAAAFHLSQRPRLRLRFQKPESSRQ